MASKSGMESPLPTDDLNRTEPVLSRLDTREVLARDHRTRGQPENRHPGTATPSHRASKGKKFSSLKEMENLVISGPEGVPTSPTRQQCTTRQCLHSVPWYSALGVFIPLLAFLVLYLLSLALQSPREDRHKVDAFVNCRWEGCQEYLTALAAGMDPKADPCTDMDAYVCGKVRWVSELYTDTVTDMQQRWFSAGGKFLERHHRPAAAFALYDACMSRNTEAPANFESMTSFMKALRLPWPRRSTGASRHFVDAILDLDINWGVHLWCVCNLRRLPGHSRYSLSVDSVHTSILWRRWMAVASSRGAQLQYAQGFYALFDAQDVPIREIGQLLEDESSILNIVSRAILDANRAALSLNVGQIGYYTQNVSSRQWMTFLNTHLRPHQLQEDDLVLLQDNALFRVVNGLLERFNNDQVLKYVAWWFVQQYADIVSAQAEVVAYGSPSEAVAARRINCYIAAESRYPDMLFTEREASSQHRPGSLAAASVFHDLVRAASRLLSSASWMGENAQKEALTILRDVKVEASTTLMTHGNKSRQWLHSWPGGASYPAPVPVLKASTGFEAWLEAARLQKRLTPSWPLDDALLNRHGRFSPVVAYSPWWNSLFIHPSVLAAPLFYVDAPISVVYGGLGSLLAAAVVRPFDMKVGSFLDANRTVRDWISPSGRSALKDKKACAESEELLMNLASVEVLLEAYQSSRVREDDDVYTLPGTHPHKLTRDMLFFVSFCRARCGLTHECKKTLKHVAAFTKAFRCPRRVGNCSFFGG